MSIARAIGTDVPDMSEAMQRRTGVAGVVILTDRAEGKSLA